jgi:hypothetical protein
MVFLMLILPASLKKSIYKGQCINPQAQSKRIHQIDTPREVLHPMRFVTFPGKQHQHVKLE